jgi:hypothetical protein
VSRCESGVERCGTLLPPRIRQLMRVYRSAAFRFVLWRRVILCPRCVPGALQRPGGVKFRGALAATAYRRIRALTAPASGGQGRNF